jgi:CheY-like chemotaxis protein
MNLVINAADAIGDREGQIAVRTGTRHLARRDLARAFAAEGLGEGDYAFIEVQDDGAGMTAEVQQKIFDPFFTTKLTGRGLGLAATLGIIRGHRGAISVESEVGRGTTFTILLPPLSTSAPAPARGAAPDTAAAARVEGMALVIDDDDTVRAVVRRILERQGLRVLDAPTGEEGIVLATQHAEQVKLVLLDLTMPGMGGEATLRRLRALWPELPVILMSGYAEDDVRQRLGVVQIQGIIEKPFDITSVQAEVQRALGAAPG